MNEISILGVPGLPEITPGANMAELIVAAAPDLVDGDILIVTSKIIRRPRGASSTPTGTTRSRPRRSGLWPAGDRPRSRRPGTAL